MTDLPPPEDQSQPTMSRLEYTYRQATWRILKAVTPKKQANALLGTSALLTALRLLDPSIPVPAGLAEVTAGLGGLGKLIETVAEDESLDDEAILAQLEEILPDAQLQQLLEGQEELLAEVIRRDEWQELYELVEAQSDAGADTAAKLEQGVAGIGLDVKEILYWAREEGATKVDIASLGDRMDARFDRLEQPQMPTAEPATLTFSPPPPPQRHHLVGRSAERKWLIQRLIDEDTASLASVRGVGGIGKTELAAHVVQDRRIQDHFDGRILWVRCGEQSIEAIQNVIAAELALQLEDYDPAVRSRLINKRLAQVPRSLIVLDDIRQDHKASIDLLRPPSPHALLVTSRLADVLSYDANLTLDELSDEQARELLAETLGGQVNLSENPEAVDQIMPLLEGMPLAIILAGRWVLRRLSRKSPPDDPLQTLLTALQSQKAEVMHRGERPQDSLLFTFNISYNNLSRADQQRIRQLGVFALNAFPLPALQLVWQEENATKARRAMQRLENAGLVREVDDDLWWMHDVLRQYAAEHLADEADEARAAAVAHAMYVELVLDSLELRTLDDWATLATFRPEVVQAGQWLLAHWEEHPEQAVGLAISLGNTMYTDTSPLPVAWLRAGLKVAQAAGNQQYEAMLANSLAGLLKNRGQYVEAERLYRTSLRVAEQLGDSRSVAVTQYSLASLVMQRGKYDEAERLLRESLAHDDQQGDTRSAAVTQSALASLLTERGKYDEAERLFRESLAVFLQLGHSREISAAQHTLAFLLMQRGQFEEAERLLRASLRVAEQLGDSRAVAVTQNALARLLMQRGQYDEAERLYRTSLTVAQQLGDSRGVAVARHALAGLLMDRGEYDKAERLYRESLSFLEGLGDSHGVAVVQHALAVVLRQRGQYDEAERLYRASLAVTEQLGDSREVAVTQEALGGLLMERGKYDEAERLLRSGLENARLARDSMTAAGIQASLGQLAAARGDTETARDLLVQAREGFLAIGLTNWAAQVDQLLDQLDGSGEDMTLEKHVALIRAALAGDRAAGQQAWDLCQELISSGDPNSVAVGKALQQILLRTTPETALTGLNSELREPLLALFSEA